MYAAIDALADKLDRRVKKHKEKLVDHHALLAQKNGVLNGHCRPWTAAVAIRPVAADSRASESSRALRASGAT